MGTPVRYLAISVLLSIASSVVAAPDWGKVPSRKITVFYPGTSSIEWVTKGSEHGGAKALRKGESCVSCHEEELADIGKKIVSGSKNEPTPIKGKAGSIAVAVQAAYDAERLYLRFSFKEPAAGASGSDKENPMKVAVMLAGENIPQGDLVGCWQTCHQDARSMPGANEKKTKYVVGADLAGAKFYDLMQWKSGQGSKLDGYVAETRVMEGGSALINAEGRKEGDLWTVTFTRKLVGGSGDVALTEGKTVPFGLAIHEGHATDRFHHVSLGYLLGLGVKADVAAVKQ